MDKGYNAGVDRISQRMTAALKESVNNGPESEQELPIIFNEYCTTWGSPSHQNIREIVDTIRGKGFSYFVIDCGWYKKEGIPWDIMMGDYEVSKELFPEGLEKTIKLIKDAGMKPGIWFEIENVGFASEIYQREEHLLKRDGEVLTTTTRRFLNMTDPWVREYLKEIKEAVPGIIIENCASGGHRLEPLMMSLTSISSFSDAHECEEIPVIAANLHRAVLPRQSQIWAVIRREDSLKRIAYSICNTFLGRMCISGDVTQLSAEQRELIEGGMAYALFHVFDVPSGTELRMKLPPEMKLEIQEIYSDEECRVSMREDCLCYEVTENRRAVAVFLDKSISWGYNQTNSICQALKRTSTDKAAVSERESQVRDSYGKCLEPTLEPRTKYGVAPAITVG